MATAESEAARRAHWDAAYARPLGELSWTQAEPGPELALVRRFVSGPDAAVIDVGAGRSRLLAALAAEGFCDLTALDVSAEALERARAETGAAVAWIVADVTVWEPTRSYDLWHDRAVLHFLTEPDEREAYRRTLLAALCPGGVAVLSAFAPDGPERCSGLPVRRYDAAAMAAFLGPGFATLAARRVEHRTPRGALQPFHLHAARRLAR